VLALLRHRRRLAVVAGLWTGMILCGWDMWVGLGWLPQVRVLNDFRLWYGAARLGLTRGWDHLYDPFAQRDLMESLGFFWQPYLNPPALAWLAVPFSLLPFELALGLWTLLLIAAAVWTWRLAATGHGLTRAMHLALFLGLFPVAFGLLRGQPVALVAFAVAGGWWLLRHRKPVPAGMLLALIAIKPQVALLVPFALLASGRRIVFLAWLGYSALLVVASLALLGVHGTAGYLSALATAAQWDLGRRYALSGVLGLGPLLYVAQALVLLLTLWTAWRARHGAPDLPVAAGLAGSLLFTPYVGYQDLAVLVPAGWLALRAGAPVWLAGLLAAGYLIVELAQALPPALVPAWELAFLVALAARAAQRP